MAVSGVSEHSSQSLLVIALLLCLTEHNPQGGKGGQNEQQEANPCQRRALQEGTEQVEWNWGCQKDSRTGDEEQGGKVTCGTSEGKDSQPVIARGGCPDKEQDSGPEARLQGRSGTGPNHQPVRKLHGIILQAGVSFW